LYADSILAVEIRISLPESIEATIHQLGYLAENV
jgi:hypothetical protein